MTAIGMAPMRKRRTPWLVSFGDLLTLMLCFFLATITFKPRLAPTKDEVTHRSNREISEVKPITAASALSGTHFANTHRRQGVIFRSFSPKSVFDFRLKNSDFDSRTGLLRRSSALGLKRIVSSSSYSFGMIEIHSCVNEVTADVGEALQSSMNRALAVRGQVIDAGVAANLVRTRILGGDCLALPGEKAQKVVTVIRFRVSQNG